MAKRSAAMLAPLSGVASAPCGGRGNSNNSRTPSAATSAVLGAMLSPQGEPVFPVFP